KTSAKLIPCAPTALRLAGFSDHTASLLVMLDQVRRCALDFDVIHFHLDLAIPFVQANFRQMPNDHAWPARSPRLSPGLPCFPGYAATIHHGLPASLYALNDLARRNG